MNRKLLWVVVCIGFLSGCTSAKSSPGSVFVLASTTSTQDSGLLDPLSAEFERTHNQYRIKVVAVGSGEAIALGRSKDADVLLVHSPDDEKQFMANGLGVSRRSVMRNDFVIAGPASDPAHITDSGDAVDAFKRISQTRAPFISRGDQSGTHKKELKTWTTAGIVPSGDWYYQSGQGMAETLLIAAERNAYVLTDTATLRVMTKKMNLVVIYKGDPKLINPYSVIEVEGAKHLDAGILFADWITSSKGQRFIADFGRKEYGSSLFTPTAGK